MIDVSSNRTNRDLSLDWLDFNVSSYMLNLTRKNKKKKEKVKYIYKFVKYVYTFSSKVFILCKLRIAVEFQGLVHSCADSRVDSQLRPAAAASHVSAFTVSVCYFQMWL